MTLVNSSYILRRVQPIISAELLTSLTPIELIRQGFYISLKVTGMGDDEINRHYNDMLPTGGEDEIRERIDQFTLKSLFPVGFCLARYQVDELRSERISARDYDELSSDKVSIDTTRYRYRIARTMHQKFTHPEQPVTDIDIATEGAKFWQYGEN